MRRILPESVLEEVGKLDPAAIAQVREEAWPDVRDPDELHDVLHSLIAFPETTWGQRPSAVRVGEAEPVEAGLALLAPSLQSDDTSSRASLGRTAGSGSPHVTRSADEWRSYFDRLRQQGRATRAEHADASYWVAVERSGTFSLLYPGARFDLPVTKIETALPSSDDALLALVTGWMSHIGPTTALQLGPLLGLPADEIEKALLRMEASGSVLRGQFTGNAPRAGAPAAHQQERVVRTAVAGPHSPPHRSHAAQADRASYVRPVHALAIALAAPHAGKSGSGRTRHT